MIAIRTDRTHSRLTETQRRLTADREQLAILDEQLVQVTNEADGARTRALVSETPIASRNYDEAARHAAAMQRTRVALVEEITKLTTTRDELLASLPDPTE
jgi:hypothetical protein